MHGWRVANKTRDLANQIKASAYMQQFSLYEAVVELGNGYSREEENCSPIVI